MRRCAVSGGVPVDPPTPEPIWILCEGAGSELHYCPMCARTDIVVGGVITAHNRQDVLAMIDRGDFDAREAGRG